MTPKLQEIVASLVAQIRAEVRAEYTTALASVDSGVTAPTVANERRRPGPPPGTKTNPRSAEELQRLTADLLALIKKTPGMKSEQLGQALGLPASALALPLEKLRRKRAVKTLGSGRHLTYTVK